MAWLAVDKDGSEWIHSEKPKPSLVFETWRIEGWHNTVKLPKGSIKKLIGKELTWSDDPVKVIIQH